MAISKVKLSLLSAMPHLQAMGLFIPPALMDFRLHPTEACGGEKLWHQAGVFALCRENKKWKHDQVDNVQSLSGTKHFNPSRTALTAPVMTKMRVHRAVGQQLLSEVNEL